MRRFLRIAVTFCGVAVAGAAGASEPGCTDDGCSDDTGMVSLYVGTGECERIPLPRQPGPHRCVMQPDKKEIKKTVYETKWVPYCLPNPYCGRCCEGDCNKPCPSCEKCVRWKRVVVKREVVVDVICCYKCVAEECGPAHTPVTDEDGVPPTPHELPTAPPAPPASRP